MNRRILAWFLSVPVIVAGVECGHWLAYRIVYPDPYLRAQALTATGHHYLDYAPLFFAVMAAVALCAFWLRVVGRDPGRRCVARSRAEVSLLPFLVVSPLAFALQECSERLLVGGWPFAAVLAPTFMPGLLFTLPFALIAFLIARLLLHAADRLRALVFKPAAPCLVALVAAVSAAARVDLPRWAALALGVGERGPPVVRLGPALASCRR